MVRRFAPKARDLDLPTSGGTGALKFGILAYGKAGRGAESDLVDRYLKRIPWGATVTELPDSAAFPPAPPNSRTVVLDERGKALSSEAFAQRLGQWRDGGVREVRFLLGPADGGLALAQSFVHQNRIRQAASSLGAASYCVEQSVRYARERKPFGEALAKNQAIQFPLVELATQCEMLRLLIYKTAWEMDRIPHEAIEHQLSDKISMCNYWANRLVCEAADRAMQVHGGIGYSRHKPFEHIYRHHRRYRITEGSEEIQMRKVAGFLFGFMGPRRNQFSQAAE